ncbi:hypothetical protein ABZY68_25670 [Streptomyces sp. NPDC006482]|uniref:hypothetical protein n=1 Tax=Streptomyces sp. NPDC006482 TaxID=3154306 RepID=UPI0033BAD39B
MRSTRRYFVILTDEFAPRTVHVEAVPRDPADYGHRWDELADDVHTEAGFLLREVTAVTEEAAGEAAERSARLTVAQRLAAEYAQDRAFDRADEDDEQAAPEPDRLPGAGQLALCGAGPQPPA